MRKIFFLFYALFCITVISCQHKDSDSVNIHYKESDHYYSMKAHFSKRKTRELEQYMNSRLGRRTNTSFVNSRIDGTIALDDHTTFYLKKYPGHIEIKLDKDENSYTAYRKIKLTCEGIKKVLAK